MTEEQYLQKRIELLENLVGALGSIIAALDPAFHNAIRELDTLYDKQRTDLINQTRTA